MGVFIRYTIFASMNHMPHDNETYAPPKSFSCSQFNNFFFSFIVLKFIDMHFIGIRFYSFIFRSLSFPFVLRGERTKKKSTQEPNYSKQFVHKSHSRKKKWILYALKGTSPSHNKFDCLLSVSIQFNYHNNNDFRCSFCIDFFFSRYVLFKFFFFGYYCGVVLLPFAVICVFILVAF